MMIIVLSITFLVVTNEKSQQGHSLEQEKLKNKDLKELKSIINTQITKSTAYKEIKEKEKIKLMKIIGEKLYITAEDN